MKQLCPFQMFPSAGGIFFNPFSDAALYHDIWNKALFWKQASFYNVDLSILAPDAIDDYFSQPIVALVRPSCLMCAVPSEYRIDFTTVKLQALQEFRVTLSFTVNVTGLMHGLAGWFDVCFIGTSQNLVLSTSPNSPPTHWYQLQLLFRIPLAVNKGQVVSGFMDWKANHKRSYDLCLYLRLEGTIYEVHETYHLQNQQYNYIKPHAADIPAQDTQSPVTLNESIALYNLY
jgi:type I protein arginine methyltransferase